MTATDTPRWLDPEARDAILRRNLNDDTPLVARMRDLALLIEIATRAQPALDAAAKTASTPPTA